VEQCKDPAAEVVVLPAEFKSGSLIWPYRAAK